MEEDEEKPDDPADPDGGGLNRNLLQNRSEMDLYRSQEGQNLAGCKVNVDSVLIQTGMQEIERWVDVRLWMRKSDENWKIC